MVPTLVAVILELVRLLYWCRLTNTYDTLLDRFHWTMVFSNVQGMLRVVLVWKNLGAKGVCEG